MRRIAADRWIDYARARQALVKLEELIAYPARARMPNLLIVGPSGMGKTMIVEKFERDHPPSYDAVDAFRHIPVVVVRMVSGPDEGRFYKRLLAAIGRRNRRAPRSGCWRARPCGCLTRSVLGSWSSTSSIACRPDRCASNRGS